jgi:hypothetical protein
MQQNLKQKLTRLPFFSPVATGARLFSPPRPPAEQPSASRFRTTASAIDWCRGPFFMAFLYCLGMIRLSLLSSTRRRAIHRRLPRSSSTYSKLWSADATFAVVGVEEVVLGCLNLPFNR